MSEQNQINNIIDRISKLGDSINEMKANGWCHIAVIDYIKKYYTDSNIDDLEDSLEILEDIFN